MTLKTILAEQAKKITPPYDLLLELQKAARECIDELRKKGITAHIGGSLAKGTVIKKEGKQDVDIFAVFKTEQEARNIGKTLEKTKLPGKLKEVHGSRDYYQIELPHTILEIVPVVKKEQKNLIENVTDFSLDHVAYVQNAITNKPELADEIRLAKSFCMAQRVYGAESYIHGFSGYALEVLTIHYGSFEKLLRNIGKKPILDPEKHFKTTKQILHELNGAKLLSPLIVVDPTYKYRNITAGLRKETYKKFLAITKEFLKKPSKEYFTKRPINKKQLQEIAKKRKAKYIEITLRTNRQEGDIAGTKMKKLYDFYKRELQRNKQKILASAFDYEGKGKTAKAYIVIQETPNIEIKGPSTKLKKEIIKKFKEARKEKLYKKKGHWTYKQNTSIQKVLLTVQKRQKEMGAEINLD